MGDTATRFDKIVNTEEKKKRTNAFVKSNSTLRGASDQESGEAEKAAMSVTDDTLETEESVDVQSIEKPQTVKREKGKKSLTLDKSGKLDLKSLINAKDGDSKSYSLYLKEKTYKELEKLAKSQNVSVSRALNDILDSIL